MSDIGSITNSVVGTSPRVSGGASASTKVVETTSLATEVSVQRFSPVLVLDPVAGVLISKDLSSNGDVMSQFPSTAAVAYLRMGLAASGEKIPSPETSSNVLA